MKQMTILELFSAWLRRARSEQKIQVFCTKSFFLIQICNGWGYKLRDFNHWNSLNFIALSGISLLVDKTHLRNMAFLSFKGSKVFSEGFKLMWLDTAICSLNTLLHSFVGITQSVIFTRISVSPRVFLSSINDATVESLWSDGLTPQWFVNVLFELPPVWFE